MRIMKKGFKFLVFAILVIIGIRVITLKYQDQPEDFADVQQWIDLGKEKVEEGKEQLATLLEEKGWDMEIEGIYDIDEEEVQEEVLTYTESAKDIQLNSEDIKSLTIQAAGCQVHILPTEKEYFSTAFDHMKKVEVSQAGNELFIKTVRETKLQEEQEDAVLYLYVPTDADLDNVELQLGAGSMEVNGLQTDSIHAAVDAGKLIIQGINAEYISVDCTAGNVQLSVLGKEEDYNYDLTCTAGNIALGDIVYNGVKEETTIENGADKIMDVNCTVGNIEISFITSS